MKTDQNLEILIVDDDEMILLLHKMIVGKAVPEQYIHQFEDGKRTLEFILANNQPEKNYLILLDINMPVMDGWELMDRLNEIPIEAHIEVAMVTSSIDYRDKMKAKNYDQIIDYIEKPLKVDKMKELLEEKFRPRST